MDSDHTTTARWSHDQVRSVEEKKANRAQKPQALKCPRCTSSHTKFCYYNNYNLSQPRYFCKTCRRYWTAGGSLRNVPIGGASRKNKRSTSSSTSSSSSSYDHMMMMIMPPAAADNQDQPPSQNPSRHHHHHHHIIQNQESGSSSMGMMMMNSLMMPLSNPMVSNINHHQDTTSTGARLFFPLEDLKPTSPASTTHHQLEGDHSNSYWTGGGSW